MKSIKNLMVGITGYFQSFIHKTAPDSDTQRLHLQSRVQLFKDIPEPFDLLVTFRTDNVQYSSLLIVNQVLHQQIKILIERRLGLHLQLKEAVRRQVKPVPKFNFGQGSYSFFKASRLVKKIFRLNQQMVLSIPLDRNERRVGNECKSV